MKSPSEFRKMKKYLVALAILLCSFSLANAQKIIKLNRLPFTQSDVKYSATEELNFQDAIRFREINLNIQIQNQELIEINDQIELDLFVDKRYRATIDKVSTDVNGTLLVRAKLNDYEHAYAFISTFEGKTFMVIEIPEEEELYMTRYNHSTKKYHLLEMDESKLNPIEACYGDDLKIDQIPSGGNPNQIHKPKTQKGPTTRDTITLLVVYTPAAASWSATNEVSINNTISLMMARAELANDNTDSLLYIELVHSDTVAYTELQSVQDLFNLRNTTDGNMDSVHVLRDQYCADLVTLIERTNHTGGTAFLLNNLSGSPTFGFSILRVQQTSWTYTAIHEFGHNLGCGHHKFQNFQAGPGIFPYSAGGRWVSVPSGNYCSIMSYENGSYYANGISHTRVAYFSNPSKFYLGAATGDSTDADNARTIRTTKSIVAGYRSGCALPAPVAVSGNNGVYCDSVVLRASGGARGTIYWQGTTSGGTSTANPLDTQTVTSSGTYYFRAQNLQGWGPEGSSAVTIINNTPSAAGSISGPANVCFGQTVTYGVPQISGAASYVWTVPSGFSGRSSSDSITLFVTNAAVSGNITVSGTNACGNGITATFPVLVNPIPGNAGSISGNTIPCIGQTLTYSVPPIADATTYVWTLPSGASGNSNTDTISVTFSGAAVSGDITVFGSNSCGSGNTSTLSVTVNSLPANAGSISGNTNPCQGQTVTYIVPPIANATAYSWTLPSGASGSSNADTINVSFSNSAVSGDITVSGTNSCGSGNSSTLSVSVNPLPANAGSITGNTNPCQGQTVTYRVPPITDATTYAWTLPSGASGSSNADTIEVTFSNTAVSGDISVTGTNSCGSGSSSTLLITVNPLPANAASISGNTNPCEGQTITYSVPPIADATAYVWSLPAGAIGNSNSDTISVTFSNTAVSGDITVTGTNACGSGNTSTLSITVNPLPANAGTISGTTTLCQGETITYRIPPIADATAYVWTLPSGAIGSSNTDTISVTFSNTAVSGDISVVGTNSCGSGNASTLSVTVNPTPPTPSISANGFVLSSDAPSGNQWYDQNGVISGANGQSYTATANGNYYTIVTLLGCESDTSNLINITSTGIESKADELEFKVFPNPFENDLTIQLDGNDEPARVEIMNTSGQMVYRGAFVKRLVIQTDQFAKGMYLVKVERKGIIRIIKMVKN
jgi:hypothetical protein